MAYSTIADLRAKGTNFLIAKNPDLTDPVVTAIIAEADNIVKTDTANVIDHTAIVTVPTVIALLSGYKTAERSLVFLYGRTRKGLDNDDIQYWADQYNTLLASVLAGYTDLGTAATGVGTFSNDAKSGIEPALGLEQYGNFSNLDDLIDERPTR